MAEFNALSGLSVTTSGSALPLTQSNGSAGFAAGELTYTATARVGTTTVTVASTLSHSTDSVQYAVGDPTTATFTDGGDLTVTTGDNTLIARVIVENGSPTYDYTITLTVRTTAMADATLSELSVTSGGSDLPFTPVFVAGAGVFTYTAEASVGTTSVTVAATASDIIGADIEYAVGDPATAVFGATNTLSVSASSNPNILTVRVTSEDGSTTQDYTIGLTVRTTAMADATLSELSVTSGGSELPFTPVFAAGAGVFTYTAEASVGTTSVTVTAIATDIIGADIEYAVGDPATAVFGATNTLSVSASSNPNILTVRVTAEDGSTTQDYTIGLTVRTTAGNDATLSALSVMSGGSDLPFTPVFKAGAGVFTYTADASVGTTSVTVTAIATDIIGADIEYAVGDPATAVFGATNTLSVSASSNPNILTVRVTAEDGSTTQDYTIGLTVRTTAMTDATLSELSVTSGGSELPFTPVFAAGAGVFTYTAEASVGTTSVTVAATATDIIGADIEYAVGDPATAVFGATNTLSVSASSNPNILTVRVTSEDGSTTQDYTIGLTVRTTAMADATLSELSVTSGGSELPFTPVFDAGAGVFTYTAEASVGTTSVTVTATASDIIGADIEYAVGDPATAVFGATNTLSVSASSNPNILTVRVTAEDDSTTQDYTITLTVRTTAMADATLSELSVTSGGSDLPFTPVFVAGAGVFTYTAEASVGTTSVTVAATASDIIGADIEYAVGDPATAVFGTTNTLPVSASSNPNILTVRVTAEDGSTTQDYTIGLTVRTTAMADATLSELSVTSGGSELPFTPVFAAGAGVFTYTAEASVGTTSVTVTAIATDIIGADIEYAVGDPATAVFGATNTLSVSASSNPNILTVRVTAEDGSTTQDYTIGLTVRTTAGNDATLSALSVMSGGSDLPFTPVFKAGAGVFTYTAEASVGTTSVTVTAIATDIIGADIEYAVGDPATAVFGATNTLSVSASSNPNILTVRVTAEDDSTTQHYTIGLTVRTTAGNNATLSALSVMSGGSELPFTPVFAAGAGVFTYTADASVGTTSVTVTATASDIIGADIEYAVGDPATAVFGATNTLSVSASSNPNILTVRVTAEDGSTTQDYTIGLTVRTTAMTDATLSELSVTSGGSELPFTPVFVADAGVFTYTAEASVGTTSVTVAATATDIIGADIEYAVGDPATAVFGTTNTLSVSASSNPNILTVRVTAEDDSTTQDYTIGLTVRTTAMADATLSELSVTSGGSELPFTPVFAAGAGVFTYTADASVGTTSVTVAATATDIIGADIEYAVGDPATAVFGATNTLSVSASSNPNILTVRVTSEDDSTTQDYTIGLTVRTTAMADATLSELSVTSGGSDLPFTPVFVAGAGVFTYTADASVGTTSVTVTAIATDIIGADIEYAVGDPATAVFGATNTLSVSASSNPNILTVRVTAEDGSTTQDYTIGLTVRTTAMTDATLSELSVTSGGSELPFTPVFAAGAGVFTYTAEASVGTTSVTVAATATDIIGADIEYAVGDPATAVFGATNTLSVSASSNPNILTVRVTSEDGSTTQDYTIGLTVRTTAGNDATLSALSVMSGGSELPFTPVFAAGAGVFTYTADASVGTTSVTVTATASDIIGADIEYAVGDPATAVFGATNTLSVSASSNPNILTVRVTAEDDSTTQHYTIGLTVRTTAGNNATLSALSVMSGGSELPFTPVFAAGAGVFTYTADASVGTTSVTVTATASDIIGADIEYAVGDPATAVFGATNTLSVSASSNPNILTVRVTAEDGSTTQDYTIGLTVRTTAMTDATLSELSVTSGGSELPFTPVFVADAGVFTYTAEASVGTTSVTVAATATDIIGADIEYAVGDPATAVFGTTNTLSVSASSNPNILTVRVTAEDGSTTQHYTIGLTVRTTAMTDATLSELSVTSGGSKLPFTPVFDAGVFTYTATARFGTTTVTVDAIAADIVGAGILYAVGVNPFGASGVLAVGVGSNTLTVRVTAEDDSTQDYTITLTVRAMPSDVFTLISLSVMPSGGSALILTRPDGITPGFDANVLTYTATAPAGTTTVTVDATAADIVGAGILYAVGANPGDGDFDDDIRTFTVSVGSDNILTVRVTAEDGSMMREYIITLTVPASTDATLSALSVTPSGGSAMPLTQSDGTTTGFAAATTIYTATAPVGTTSVAVDATPATAATVVIAGTAADGSTALGVTSTTDTTVTTVTGLTAGDNTITITVTAQDERTMLVYTITLTVPAANTEAAFAARLNEKILTHTLQAVSISMMAEVTERVESTAGDFGTANTNGSSNLAYQFGGQSSLNGLLQAHGKAMLEEEMDYERLLDGASFVIPLSTIGDQFAGNTEDNSDHTPTDLLLWGGSDYRNLDGNEDGLDWDGQMFSAHLGMDEQVNEEVLVGLALAWHHADFDFRDRADGADRSGDYQYQTINLHPYVGWLPNDKFKVWGTAGYGVGGIEITETGGTERSTDSTHLSLAGGFSNRILRVPGLLPDSVTTINIKIDSSVARVEVDEDEDAQFAAQNIDNRHLRLLAFGEQRLGMADGGSLATSLEVGVRYDGGDGVTGFGVETGTGLHYANPDGNLTLSGTVRSMRLNDYKEWGVDILFQLLPPGGRGLSFQIHPVWGRTQSATERLWNEGTGELGGDDVALQGSLAVEVGYGFSASMLGTAGVLMPFLGMNVEDSESNRTRLGSRFSGDNGLILNLESEQKNTDDGADHTVLLRGEFAF